MRNLWVCVSGFLFWNLVFKTQTSAHTSNQEHVHFLNMWFFPFKGRVGGLVSKIDKRLVPPKRSFSHPSFVSLSLSLNGRDGDDFAPSALEKRVSTFRSEAVCFFRNSFSCFFNGERWNESCNERSIYYARIFLYGGVLDQGSLFYCLGCAAV